MGYNKITNLLGKLTKDEIPKFTTIKWIEIFDQSNGTYDKNSDIRFKTKQLRNDLCDFNDAYIVVTGKIIVTSPGNDANQYNRKVSLKNSAPFFNCILKINNQLIEDAQDLDIIMPMYNLLNYSKNFRKTTGSFWNYYLDMPKSGHDNNANLRQRIIYPIKDSESFDYKTKLIGNVPGVADPADGDDIERELEDIKIVVPLKNLSNFMFNLDFLLINSEIELILKWTEGCVLTEKATREFKAQTQNPAQDAVSAINRPKDLKFSVTDCKLYVPVVTLQTEYQNQLHKELQTGMSIDFTWSRYRSQMINQTATNNLNFLIDPTFNNVNRLFVLAFPNGKDRRSFSKYYTPTVEIKDYNVIIDREPFYEIPIKNKEETYKAITELIRNDLLRTGNEFNFEYFCEHYKLIAIDLSKQKPDLKNQQINFIGKLEQNATIFFIIEEKEITGLNFLKNSLAIA